MSNDFISGLMLVLVLAVPSGAMFCAAGMPHYRVYNRNLSGQAALAEAEWTKRILIEDAKAKQESAKLLAMAEVERAKGVAAANEIIGASLEGNEGYLRYLWIQGLQDGSSEVIYIPTEANLPILEARPR